MTEEEIPGQMGLVLKAEGQALVLEHEEETWKHAAALEIEALAAIGQPFTAEDVAALVGRPTRPNAMGAAMSAAVRRGQIRRVGYRTATRPDAHARVIAVWGPA